MAKTRIPLPKAMQEQLARKRLEDRLQMSLAETVLPVRTVNILEEHGGILTVQDLLESTPEDLLKLPNFGEKTLEEVGRVLRSLGLPGSNSSAGGPRPR
jgi:DNA-directed RNA polymerase alpha subunit